jgi:integrase/recombinase XerD
MSTALQAYRAAGPLPEYIRKEEAHAALRRLEGSSLAKRRAHAFLRCLWELGPRVTELLGLKVGHIDWMAHTVRLVTLKQKPPKDTEKRKRWKAPWRVLPASEGLLAELADYLTAAGLKESGDLAWTWGRRFGHSICFRTLKAVGVEAKRANPRAMRHGFAVNCAMQGTPLPVIQQMLGHADALTTSIYMRIIASDTKPWLDKVEF